MSFHSIWFLAVFYLCLLVMAIQDIKHKEIHINYFVILFLIIIIELLLHINYLYTSVWAMVIILVLFDIITNIGNIFVLKNKNYIQGLPLIITLLVSFIVYLIYPASSLFLTWLVLGVFIVSELIIPAYIYNFAKDNKSQSQNNNIVMGGADSLLIGLIGLYHGDIFFVIFAFIISGAILLLLQLACKLFKYTLPRQIPFVPFFVVGVFALDMLMLYVWS